MIESLFITMVLPPPRVVLLLACCSCIQLASSLSLVEAWCSSNNSGCISHRRSVASAPKPSKYHHKANFFRISSSSSPLSIFQLGSQAKDNDGDGNINNVDNDTSSRNDDIDAAEQMTPANASKLLIQFWSMSIPYYIESQPGRQLFYIMIALTLINSGVSVTFSYISKDFWNALSNKNTDEFYTMLVKFGSALIVGAPVSVMYRYQREQLAVHWREWMTERTLVLYKSNRVYYSLERDIAGVSSTTSSVELVGVERSSSINDDDDTGVTSPINTSPRIDNPDQRITEDVRTFTAFSLQLFITLATSIIDLVSFSLILYSIQPQLFGTIVIYAAFGTFMTVYIGKSLLPLNFDKLRREADLRYLLVRIRENAESIAFYGGEDVEGIEAKLRLSRVIDNRRMINVAQRNLEFFTTCYQYLIQVVPVAVVAPQYFAGKIQLGVISQSNGAFNHILNDLTVIVNQFEQLSSFSAGIERLSSFYEAMRDADTLRNITAGLLALPSKERVLNEPPHKIDAHDDGGEASMLLKSGNTHVGTREDIELNLNRMLASSIANNGRNTLLQITNLCLMTPDRKRTLIDNLNLAVNEGENLLIVGNSGSGKSSLLRAIAGLWTSGSGEIMRIPDDEVYFLPQRPYCALGSLKDQLLYPSTELLTADDAHPDGHNTQTSRAHVLRESWTDKDLLDVLAKVDLKELPYRFGDGKDPIKGLNAVLDWGNTLSLGEQQRLAFGRVIVNQPRLVIVDEATSALDVDAERNMYSLLLSMAGKDHRRYSSDDQSTITLSGLTFISVGHRPTLLAYHDVKLRLMGGSNYTIEAVEKVSIPASINML